MLDFEAKKISELRVGKGLTVQEFAYIVGTSKQAVSAWETGSTLPRVDTLLKICNRFNVPVNFFIFSVHHSEQH